MRDRFCTLVVSGLLGSTVLASSARAQEASIVAFPVRQYVDENGVDLLSVLFTTSSPGIRIGSADMGLAYVREIRGATYRDTMMGTISVSGSTYTVDIAGRSEAFTLSAGIFTPVEQNGSTLSATGLTYTYARGDGTTATFDGTTYAFGNASGISITSLTYPSGRTLSFYYTTASWTNGSGVLRTGRRLQSVTTNAGYHMKLSYDSDVPNSGTTSLEGRWARVTTVKGLNSSVDSCTVTAFSCPQTGRPLLTIGPPATGIGITMQSYTDSENRTTTYTFTGPAGSRIISGIQLPGSAADNVSITNGGAGRTVSSITRFGVTTTYAYSDLNNVRTVTVTRTGGSTRVLTFDLTKNVMLSDQNELGKTTTYQYDANNRVTRITLPEGNYTQLAYDTRGNVTEARGVAKAGSGLSDIVASAAYPATCTVQVTCNSPTSITDPRNNTTDFTYDTTHGGVLTITRPAPTVGAIRPEVRMTYARLDANGAASASGIFVPTGSSVCQSGSAPACVGTADEVKTTISYGYGLLPSSVSTGAGDNSLTATTAATYDVIGNLTYVDGALPGSADNTRMLYNLDRELVGIIGPDPDGAGALKNRASRLTYGTTGLITKSERGTTTGQTDGAWSAFSTAETIDLTYDSNRRPITQKLSAGGTSYALTQFSYDTRGRPQCSAVRMNTAAYGSLPADACTLGTPGSFGPDRVTKAIYDNASEVTQLQVAVGTTDAANERTLTYSDNGAVTSLLDAENNKTSYVYDGFDRLSQTLFPSATKGAGTSNANDYEQLTYDADGNVTNRRLRDGTSIAFTYDNLNRPTLQDLPGSDPDVTIGYDNLSRVTTMSQPGYSESFGYDALSRQTAENQGFGNISRSFDLAGRMTRTTWWDGFYVDYDRLVTGEISKVRENGASSGVGVLASYGYDDLGRRTSEALGNGASQSFTYDAVSRLASLTNDLSGTMNDLSAAFSYNPASQVISTVRTGDSYAFTGFANENTNTSSNGLNQQVTVGGASAAWDSRGNLTTDPTTSKIYTYWSSDMLKSASGGVTLYYDPLQRLTEYDTAVSTRFVHDGMQVAAEVDNPAGAIQKRYVWGDGADELVVQYGGTGTSNRNFASADERGSIISLTDSAGGVIGINKYDEFGRPASGNIGRFQYTGQVWLSEAGIYNYKARAYLPHLGMFAQTDPIGYAASPNPYVYVLSDPVNLADPLGLCESPEGCVPNTVTYGPDGITLTAQRWDPLAGGALGAMGGGGGRIILGRPAISRQPGTGGGGRSSGGRRRDVDAQRQAPRKPAFCFSAAYQMGDDIDRLGRKAQYFALGAVLAARGEQYGYMRTLETRGALAAYSYIGYGRLFGSGLKVWAGDRMPISDFVAEAIIKYAGVDALGEALGGTALDFVNDKVRKDPCKI